MLRSRGFQTDPYRTPKKTFPAIGVVLVSLLLNLNIIHTFSSASIVNLEQVNADWVCPRARGVVRTPTNI